MSGDDAPMNRMCMIVVSSLSAAASLSIIAAYYLLPSLRSRKYYEVLFYIAFSNLLTSIGSSLGIPRDRSAACWFQGLTTSIFTLSSIFWTVVIALMLKEVIDNATIFDIKPWIHAICWGVPIFVSLLPLVEVRYGSTGKDWCFIDKKDSSFPGWKITMWTWLSFYLWVFLACGAILYVYMKVLQKKFVRMTEKVLVEKMFNKLKFYPLVIIFCWLPSSIYDTGPQLLQSLNIASTVLSCLHGFVFACVFWYMNSEVLSKSGDDSPRGGARGTGSNPLFDMYLSSGNSGNDSQETKDTQLTRASSMGSFRESSIRESSVASSVNPMRGAYMSTDGDL